MLIISHTMVPLGISAAAIGIAEAALAAHLDYQRERVGATGTAIKDDPYVMYSIGEAAADINAARQELLANADSVDDMVAAGKEVSFADRAAGRGTQIRAVWRAVGAVDQIFARSGSNASRMDTPLQRYWRDVHVAHMHAIHVPGTAYHAAAFSSLGSEPEGALRALISRRGSARRERPEKPRLHHVLRRNVLRLSRVSGHRVEPEHRTPSG